MVVEKTDFGKGILSCGPPGASARTDTARISAAFFISADSRRLPSKIKDARARRGTHIGRRRHEKRSSEGDRPATRVAGAPGCDRWPVAEEVYRGARRAGF